MKIGLIFTAYQLQEYVRKSLDPWIKLKEARTDGHEITIVAITVPFLDFPFDNKEDDTINILKEYLNQDKIDYLITDPKFIPETTARSMGLNYLKDRNVDISIQWDVDEVTDVNSILRMLKFIDNNEFVDWFRIAYKNLVFTEDQYLAETFTPPRIHRLKTYSGLSAVGFQQDNDICYQDKGGKIVFQNQLANMCVPAAQINPLHYTWLNNSRSKKKIEYQLKRWGDACSFRWDDSKGGLIFNPNLPIPKIIKL